MTFGLCGKAYIIIILYHILISMSFSRWAGQAPFQEPAPLEETAGRCLEAKFAVPWLPWFHLDSWKRIPKNDSETISGTVRIWSLAYLELSGYMLENSRFQCLPTCQRWSYPSGFQDFRAFKAKVNQHPSCRRPALLKHLARRCFPGNWTFEHLSQRGSPGFPRYTLPYLVIPCHSHARFDGESSAICGVYYSWLFYLRILGDVVQSML